MCGIFGIIAKSEINQKNLKQLALHSRQRGRDSSGLLIHEIDKYKIIRADYDLKKLIQKQGHINTNFVMGHSRLITNGLTDNQPVMRNGVIVIHNGIIINDNDIWKDLTLERELEVDTEAITGIAIDYLEKKQNLKDLPVHILSRCQGTISSALALPKIGKLCLFSNNGSLYVGKIGDDIYFASEKYALNQIKCVEIKQVMHEGLILDIPLTNEFEVKEENSRLENLIPKFKNISAEEGMLIYKKNNIRRCKKCILPETMPFIHFDEVGVCNYCKNYKIRNKPRQKEELLQLLEPYKKKNGADCIVPFSGGRDSCWGLHLIVNELKMKPITYTYDWGMVTDLGRRNISRMCAALQVENIIVADDISKKRRNIALNLKAWLKEPNLGMVSILTAGDKHFFRHVETIKQQTNIKLNLWGVNPLEVTHFKSGFLGVKPDFEEKLVYSNGWTKQINYQLLRLKAMIQSPGYFNSSLWDTVSGEYYRSFTKKRDYYHIFDYWRWDENICNETLKLYDWELAPDTSTTWRIGDGTAALYNYIYYTMAGFTEHDTFRSNQIREGQITREEALKLVEDENTPRYQNIRWYLDAIGMDFTQTIKRINDFKLESEINH